MAEIFPGENEITAALRTCASSVQHIIVRYEGLLEFRQRQLETAAATIEATRRRETVADALQGYSADLERYASELERHVDDFTRAADLLRSNYVANFDWSDAHVHHEADEPRKHIDRLKFARAASDLIRRAADTVIIHDRESTSAAVRAALRHYRAVLDRYRVSLERVESLSMEVLGVLGVDADSVHRRGQA